IARHVILARLWRVGLAGETTPATVQDVGTPWLGYDFGTANRRRGLETDATTGVYGQHLGFMQFVSSCQCQTTAHRSLGGLGGVRYGLRRKAVMRLIEPGAAGKFG